MFKNYLKLAFKVLLRRKMFTFINLFGISFTLMILLATTAIYTLSVVSNPVQKNLSRTLVVNQIAFQDSQRYSSGPLMPYFIEKAIRPIKKNVELISLCDFRYNTTTIYLNNQRTDIDTRQTDENYWKMFTYRFLEGAPYNQNDIRSGKQVMVISQTLKERIFGDAPALGKKIHFNNNDFKITGVVSDIPKLYLSAYSQIWIPYNYVNYVTQVKNKSFDSWEYQVLIQVDSPSNFDKVRAHFKRNILNIIPPDHFKKIVTEMESSFQYTFKSLSDNGNNNWLLIAFSILFSLIPLINLTNLTVSRIYERSSEIGVRKSFGATRKSMMIQFVYENLIITILGGLIGFLFAWLLIRMIDSSQLISLGKITFTLRVYLAGFGLIVLFGICSGLYPAYKMSKLQIIHCLKGGIK